MYSVLASRYDELYGEEQQAKINMIIPYLEGWILDVGAGTGLLARSAPNVMSLDPCKEMIAFAPEPKICASAESIPFAEGAFNTIVSLTVLHHCAIDKVIKEFKRLKPKKLVLSILKRSIRYKEIKAALEESFGKPFILEDDKDTILIFKQEKWL